jgi:protein arginine N-methyltransferase 7
LSPLLARECAILPVAATIRAIAVEFEHLWKIRAAVGICEGFDLKTFDSLIEVGLTAVVVVIMYILSCVN